MDVITKIKWDGAYGTIYTSHVDGLIAEYNSIDSTGYAGILYLGSNVRINNNHIQHFCLNLQDGGGIYTWTGPQNPQTTNNKIYNNIVHDGFGDNLGTTERIIWQKVFI